jgi:hypothetical protein
VQKKLFYRQQKILFDHDATIALYRDTITVPGAERCTCDSCKNFAAQRDKAFPEKFIEFLKDLGIDPRKEWEAFNYDFDTETNGAVLYGGWFQFVGELVEGRDVGSAPEEHGFAHWFTTNFPGGTFPRDLKLCAVEFLVRIPWIFQAAAK